MSIDAAQAMREALADPAFLAKIHADMAAKAKRKSDFAASDTFKRMCTALTSRTEPAGVNNEEVAYFENEVKARLGWDGITEGDIRLFFDVVGDPDAPTVEPGSATQDPDNSFENISFRHFGLQVFMMFGQGTFVSIDNGIASPASLA